MKRRKNRRRRLTAAQRKALARRIRRAAPKRNPKPAKKALARRPAKRKVARKRRRAPRRNKGFKLFRNPEKKLIKALPVSLLKAGGGFVSSVLLGQFAGQMSGSQYGPVLGSAVTALGSQILQAKMPKAQVLGGEFSAGAYAAAFMNLMDLLVQKGILTGSLARYLAPLSYIPAAVPAVPANGTEAAMEAYVAQQGLYGMGNIAASMQHNLAMQEQGMAGGIFDGPTTLGDYDILESAPPGTAVQAGMAEYLSYPMGAAVEQATAGLKEYVSVPMGATVEEAFAGMGDFVSTGGPQQYWSQSPRGQAILVEIRNAAAKLTAARRAQGMPIDAAFKANLVAAAKKAAAAQGTDVAVQPAPSPLTREAAPFPGMQVGDVGAIAGDPALIGPADEYMDEEDSGIFG